MLEPWIFLMKFPAVLCALVETPPYLHLPDVANTLAVWSPLDSRNSSSAPCSPWRWWPSVRQWARARGPTGCCTASSRAKTPPKPLATTSTLKTFVSVSEVAEVRLPTRKFATNSVEAFRPGNWVHRRTRRPNWARADSLGPRECRLRGWRAPLCKMMPVIQRGSPSSISAEIKRTWLTAGESWGRDSLTISIALHFPFFISSIWYWVMKGVKRPFWSSSCL